MGTEVSLGGGTRGGGPSARALTPEPSLVASSTPRSPEAAR